MSKIIEFFKKLLGVKKEETSQCPYKLEAIKQPEEPLVHPTCAHTDTNSEPPSYLKEAMQRATEQAEMHKLIQAKAESASKKRAPRKTTADGAPKVVKRVRAGTKKTTE